MKIKTTLKTTLAALTLAGGAALALPAAADNAGAATSSPGMSKPIDGNPQIQKLDKDKDGTISRKEAKSDKELSKNWDTLDANSDGKLDAMELATADTGSMDAAPGGNRPLTR